MKKFAKVSFLVLFGFGVFLGPVSSVLAQENQGVASPAGEEVDYSNRLENCVLNPTVSGGTFAACFVNVFYYLILYPSAWFASTTAELLDVFIAYSLDSNSYASANGEFINKGWGIIRDIANVMFIFILLYIAIRHILQLGTSETKKLLLSIIIAALLINFSLFFSKVVIDAGNILARAFYNNIEVQYYDGGGVKPISQALAAKVHPQKILGEELFNPEGFTDAGVADGKLPDGYAFFILVIAAFVNVTMGVVFLSTFLLFAARVIGLWFMMIFSPIAFASLALPGGGGAFGQFGWNGWKDNLVKLSFMAPVFLFFLFLTIMFLNIILGSESILAGNETTTQRLASVLIPFTVIILLLKYSKKIAGDMAGEIGKQVTGAVGKALGGALSVTTAGAGLALGAAAMAGRRFIGGAATRELASGVNQRQVTQFNRMARQAERSGNMNAANDYRQRSMEAAAKVSKLKSRSEASFDMRRSEFLQKQVLGSKLGKLAGSSIQNLGSEAFGGAKLGIDLGKGKDTSIAKQEEARKKKALDEAKLYETGGQDEQNLALVGYAARKGLNAQAEVIEHLDRYAEEIRNDTSRTVQERAQISETINAWRNRAQNAQTDAQMREIISGVDVNQIDGNGNYVVDAQGNRVVVRRGTDGEAKEFARESKNAFADVVEAREQNNSVVNFYGMNPRPETQAHYSSVVADQLRKGDKSAGKKTMDEFINDYLRDNPPNNNNNQNPPPNNP